MMAQLSWPEAIVVIVGIAAFALIWCVDTTRRWPWQKGDDE